MQSLVEQSYRKSNNPWEYEFLPSEEHVIQFEKYKCPDEQWLCSVG